jgi:hypothetical protein
MLVPNQSSSHPPPGRSTTTAFASITRSAWRGVHLLGGIRKRRPGGWRTKVIGASVIAFALLLVGPAGVGLAGAAPAQAAPCYGYSCHGLDPAAAGCPVSSTVTTYGALATVWNRYSHACNANWVRAQLTPAAIAAHYQWMIEITTQDSRNLSERSCAPTYNNNVGYLDEQCVGPIDYSWSGYSSVWYSDMVDGTHLTTAQVIVFQPSTAPWPWLSVASYSASQ